MVYTRTEPQVVPTAASHKQQPTGAGRGIRRTAVQQQIAADAAVRPAVAIGRTVRIRVRIAGHFRVLGPVAAAVRRRRSGDRRQDALLAGQVLCLAGGIAVGQ